MARRRLWSRLAVVVPVATDRPPLPETTWTARREVVLGNGAADNGNSSSSSMAKAGQADNNNPKVRAGEVAIRGKTAEKGKAIDRTRIRVATVAAASDGNRCATDGS